MKRDVDGQIKAFLAGSPIAVVGANTDRSKWGNKVLQCYIEHGIKAYPVHPSQTEIEGLKAYANLAAIPERVHAVSIITPYPITEKVVEQAGELGIEHLWMQPGAESAKAIARAEELGISVIAGGPCVLVELGWSGH